MVYVVLNNIRSGWNVGSIFRTCDALGFSLILVGYTMTPVQKNSKIIHKTAIGAEEFVDWQKFDHYMEVFQTYSKGLHLAIEISKTSQNLFHFFKQNPELLDLKKPDNDIFLWFGNEIHGLPEEIIKLTKQELHLDMYGKKESLNIASTVCSVGYLLRFINYSDKL
jgi:tRNA G18 (ribose-2'-O)-methylase SpoU